MRDYIQKHLQPQAAAYMKQKRAEIAALYEAETFCHSSIPGKATSREGLKNCFIAGEVMQKGSCRLLGCSVAPNVQLILEEGATAVNCLFGSMTVSHVGNMVIHIGKNALVQDSLILIDTDIGAESVIHKSYLGNITQHFRQYMPTFKCGRGSLIYCSAIRQGRGRQEEQQVDTVLGNRATVLLSVLKTHETSFTAGDDFILCDYATAIQMCLYGIAIREPDIAQSPLLTIGHDSEHSVVAMQDHHPQMSTFLNSTVGNRFYCGCEFMLDKCSIKKPVPTAVIGDDVNIVSTSKAVTRQNYERSTIDLILCADTLEVSDGATLVGSGNQRWPVPYYRKLTLRENAVVHFTGDNNAASDLTAPTGKAITW